VSKHEIIDIIELLLESIEVRMIGKLTSGRRIQMLHGTWFNK